MSSVQDNPIAVLLVAPDRAAYAALETTRLPSGKVALLGSASSAAEAISKIHQMKPEVALIDADTPGIDCFELARQIEEMESAPSAVLISESRDPASFRRAIQSGVEEYLIKPVAAQEIAETIAEVAQSRRTRKPRETAHRAPAKCEVIALVSARGGAGKSTIATNLAISMAQEPGKKAALFDMLFGETAVMMGVEPKSGLSDLSRALPEADLETLRTYGVQHHTGVDVYVAYPEPRFAEYTHLNGNFASNLCSMLHGTYDVVLIEYPLLLGSEQLKVLSTATQVIVVTNGLELMSLRETRGLIAAIADIVVPQDRLKIIVNRWDPRGVISAGDVERTIGSPVWAYLPNDERLVIHCINVGVPLVIERPASPLALQLKALARRLIGAPPEQSGKKLFSFLG